MFTVEEAWGLVFADIADAFKRRGEQLLTSAAEARAALAEARALTDPDTGEDKLLTAREAADILRVSAGHVYANADSYPFTVRHGRVVRFSRRGIYEYLRTKLGTAPSAA